MPPPSTCSSSPSPPSWPSSSPPSWTSSRSPAASSSPSSSSACPCSPSTLSHAWRRCAAAPPATRHHRLRRGRSRLDHLGFLLNPPRSRPTGTHESPRHGCAPAISTGCPARPRKDFVSNSITPPSVGWPPAGCSGVHTGPGATALTRMPRGASCVDRPLDIEFIAAFVMA